ncbi:hypothetical protein MUK42_35697 [Musa troglodytarum]|uniref:Uncharacterized protein n=1 Tax=Musa troglodytarum TaxID=320322 RepID=A0A9E7FBU8_9LILI|nr:hypothetical protein MUK42_35697 [Musa troglodytarum]
MLLDIMRPLKAPHLTSFLIHECLLDEGPVSLPFILALSLARPRPWAGTPGGCLRLGTS